MITGSALVGGVGYLLLVIVDNSVKIRYLGIWLATMGVFPALALNITWLLNNNQGDSKRGAGLALLATFGQCSSFVSSVLFPTTQAPFYHRGCAVGCGLTFSIAVLAMINHIRLVRENKRRDRVYGLADITAQLDVTAAGDRNANFRYLT